jgi:hypothetical protein
VEGSYIVRWVWPARRGGVPHGGCKQQGGLVLCAGRGMRLFNGGFGVGRWSLFCRGNVDAGLGFSGGNFPVALPVAVARHCRRFLN